LSLSRSQTQRLCEKSFFFGRRIPIKSGCGYRPIKSFHTVCQFGNASERSSPPGGQVLRKKLNRNRVSNANILKWNLGTR